MNSVAVTFEIDPADLGIIRVAFLDAIISAIQRRQALDGIEDYKDIVKGIDHRLAVLESVKTQVADQECAEISS